MRIMNNISAMNAHRLYTNNNSKLSKSLEKLSSGYAINRAGDNAAGLAVSEKMRAQIAGLEQASKNAQDGISMVQTYEGALTETDSILQRMRSLAVQSANGSYDNSVDRVAIEQEYKQLNDELNQIADTDFNGVIVLNGGQMADGLKAVNGTFDYANAERDPKQLSSSDVNTVEYHLFDDVDGTDGVTKADTVWKALNADWKRNDASLDNNGPDSVDVTLKYDESTNKWAVDGISGAANKDAITVGNTPDNGGFDLTAGGIKFANVIIDETKLQNGDTITLTLSNPAAGIDAPTNAGSVTTNSSKFVAGAAATDKKAQDLNLTTTLTAVADTAMSESINKIYDALDGATFEASYTKAAATDADDVKFTFADGTSITGGGADDAFTLENGTKVWVDATATAGTVEISSVKADGTKGDVLATFAMTSVANTDGGSGSVTYTIGIERNSYDTSKVPTVTVKEPEDAGVSKSNALNQSAAKLTYADGMSLQVGARTKDLVDFTFKYDADSIGDLKADLDCSARGLGTDKLSLATQESANAAIDKIDHAINKISMVRGTFGAIQNRLEHKISNLDTNNENLSAAESRIRDTDMAAEMMEFTKNQILSQASQSMLAQANQLPQGVLSLLQ